MARQLDVSAVYAFRKQKLPLIAIVCSETVNLCIYWNRYKPTEFP